MRGEQVISSFYSGYGDLTRLQSALVQSGCRASGERMPFATCLPLTQACTSVDDRTVIDSLITWIGNQAVKDYAMLDRIKRCYLVPPAGADVGEEVEERPKMVDQDGNLVDIPSHWEL